MTWAIDVQVPLDVRHQVPHALARVVAGALIMAIAKGPLNRIGPRAVGGQREELEAGMGHPPFLALPGMVNLGGVGHHGERGERRWRVSSGERVEQVQEEARGFTLPDPGGDGPGGNI